MCLFSSSVVGYFLVLLFFGAFYSEGWKQMNGISSIPEVHLTSSSKSINMSEGILFFHHRFTHCRAVPSLNVEP